MRIRNTDGQTVVRNNLTRQREIIERFPDTIPIMPNILSVGCTRTFTQKAGYRISGFGKGTGTSTCFDFILFLNLFRPNKRSHTGISTVK